jgi:hypothetical protein
MLILCYCIVGWITGNARSSLLALLHPRLFSDTLYFVGEFENS